jgi:hypothetical protein
MGLFLFFLVLVEAMLGDAIIISVRDVFLNPIIAYIDEKNENKTCKAYLFFGGNNFIYRINYNLITGAIFRKTKHILQNYYFNRFEK